MPANPTAPVTISLTLVPEPNSAPPVDTWMMPYFGNSVYDDPAVYAKTPELSAL